ncbi:MAG: hypothetical protein AAGE52_22510 [Myxococcota bacterium]
MGLTVHVGFWLSIAAGLMVGLPMLLAIVRSFERIGLGPVCQLCSERHRGPCGEVPPQSF